MRCFLFRSKWYLAAVLLLILWSLHEFVYSQSFPSRGEPLHETILVDLVDLYLTATDSKGNFVTDLRQDEISVEEDGVPQMISRFESFAGEKRDVPMSLAFMIDNSGSMYDEIEGLLKIDLARDTGLMLIPELGPLDQMMLISFDESPQVTPLSSDKQMLTETLKGIRVHFGYTALFDSLLSTIDQLNLEGGRKVLVLCSDGQDNLSQHKIDSVLQKLADSPELTVVVLGTVATDIRSAAYRKRANMFPSGKEILQKMADRTAGYAFFPTNLKDAERVKELIRSFVRGQYSLAYRSTNRNMDGSWRTIRIACKRGGVALRYRNGYYAR